MRRRLKKTLFVAADVLLAAYILLGMTSFNKADDRGRVCDKVAVTIADEGTNGFLSAAEIRRILEKDKLYPYGKKLADVNPRDIEDKLKATPFVKTAECYKTPDGYVSITMTQRMPVIRIKNVRGADYYLDDNGGIMPNSKYTSDLIIATGYINEWYARNYLSPLAQVIMADDLWKNQIEQINILPDLGVELVPRVGNHIVYMGRLPQTKFRNRRNVLVTAFAKKKLDRLGKFYKYGLNQAGWNKYSYIDIEFDNQIICKKRRLTANK